MPLRTPVLEEINNTLGHCLPAAEREALADRIVTILEDFNRAVALAAVETVKSTLVQATSDAATLADKKLK